MKELPILFSTPMVQALLAGIKTMTRRIVKDTDWITNDNEVEISDNGKMVHFTPKGQGTSMAGRVSKYEIGDLLWVKESYYAYGKWVKNGLTKKGSQKFKFVDLTADDYLYNDNPPKTIQQGRSEVIGWYKRPSLFMPKAAARIWLKVTDIKVERLQDITEEDAVKEGVETLGLYPGYNVSAKGKFEGLWNLINGDESFDANPWVFAYSFDVISTTGAPIKTADNEKSNG